MPQSIIQEKIYPIAKAEKEITVDLVNQQIRGPDDEVLVEHFDVEPFRKHCLVNGLDDIGITLTKSKFIDEFEALRKNKFSFIEMGSRKYIPVKGAKKSPYGNTAQEW